MAGGEHPAGDAQEGPRPVVWNRVELVSGSEPYYVRGFLSWALKFSSTGPPGAERRPVGDVGWLAVIYYKVNGAVPIKDIFMMQHRLDEICPR